METAFVRREIIAPAPPPGGQSGVVRWMRENLFATVLSTILTVLSLLLVGWLVWSVFPWFANSVWDAKNLDECRAILGDKVGACFAVITDRWPQLIFGPTYPIEERWRFVLAFILLFVALAPLLYPMLPRKLMWISAAYPFVAAWLVWGGTIWLPVMIAVGFVLSGVAFMAAVRATTPLLAIVAAVLVPVFWWLFAVGPLTDTLQRMIPAGLTFIPSRDLGGLQMALIVGLSGIILSLPLGIILALGRQSNLFILHWSSVIFIEFVRGVPLITVLLVAQSVIYYFFPPGTDLDIVLRVVILVVFFSAAYMAETIRGGLAALPKGQTEAANALGMDYWTAQRLIILPQALKISIPGIVNNFIGLFKDTTLVGVIGIYDMLGAVSAIRASTDWQGVNWELFVAVGAVFFVFCFSMSRYSMWLERRLRTDRR
jgi:general L-amino acid transport system permease protein